MAPLDIKVELYLGRSFVLGREVVFRNIGDGNGSFISDWNIKDKPEPTMAELTAFDEEATRIEKVRIVQNARRADYPPLGDQLDMLWHSMDKGEIEKSMIFYETLKVVKDDHPK